MNSIFFNLVFYNIVCTVVYFLLYVFAQRQFWIHPKVVLSILKFTIIFFIVPFIGIMLMTYDSINNYIRVSVNTMEDTNNIYLLSKYSLNQTITKELDTFIFLCMVIWIIGLVIFFIKTYKRNEVKLHFLRIGLTHDEILEREFELIRKEMGIKRIIDIYRSPCVPSPCFVKFKNYTILVPNLNDSKEERNFFLRHELLRFKGRDLMYLKIIKLMQILFWFNPSLMKLHDMYSLYSEIICDEVIISGDEATKLKYIMAIQHALQTSIHMKENYQSVNFVKHNHNELIGRMNYMINFKKNIKTKILSFVLLATVFISMPSAVYAGTVGLNNSVGKMTNQIRETTYDEVGPTTNVVDINDLQDEEITGVMNEKALVIMPRGYNAIDLTLDKSQKALLYSIELPSSEYLSVNLSSGSGVSFKFLACKYGASTCKVITASGGRINQDISGFDGSKYTLYIENGSNSASNTIRGYIENYSK